MQQLKYCLLHLKTCPTRDLKTVSTTFWRGQDVLDTVFTWTQNPVLN